MIKRSIVRGLSLCSMAAAVLLWGASPVFAESKTFTNSIGMEFVLIPAGSFMMGTPAPNCPQDDPFTEKNEYQVCRDSVNTEETPQHKVVISKSFYMGRYEVTQEEWYKIMGSNPSEFKSEKVGGNSRRHPVENVSWDDVQVFIRKLNQKEGSSNYRLPTEAEWEYAAQAGSTGKYCFGDSEGQLGQYAWYNLNSSDKTHPVGQKQPNAWGLYDMHGNVYEWVQDWYGETYYAASSSADPSGPSSGSNRVKRGGSWYTYINAWFCRSAYRDYCTPSGRNYSLGFRLVLSP